MRKNQRMPGNKMLFATILMREQQTKREFLGEWVRAVNSHSGFGTWAADVSRNPTDIHEILQRHGRALT